jgi:cytochrome c oxidase cbb3-type subunit 3
MGLLMLNVNISAPGLSLVQAIGLVFIAVLPLAVQAQNEELAQQLLLASPQAIRADADLLSYTNSLAEAAIDEHCAACHGAELTGDVGVPSLVDYEWIWGVTGFEMTEVEPMLEIMQTILYGVRNQDCDDAIKTYGACPDTRYSEMPAYGQLGMDEDMLNNLVDYVFYLSGEDVNPFAVEAAESTWPVCAECHGTDGSGFKPFGAPDLTDDVWLFGSSGQDVFDVLQNGRMGVCPAWAEVLDAATIKALAVYILNRVNGF